MRQVFSRINPYNTALRGPWTWYQTVVNAQWSETDPYPTGQRLPAELQHLQRLHRIDPDKPEATEARRKLDAFEGEGRVVRAAGQLAAELIERARWLLARGESEAAAQADPPRWRTQSAALPLEVDGFPEAKATVTINSERQVGGKPNQYFPRYVQVQFLGQPADATERGWTYASVSNDFLNLAPTTADRWTPSSVGGIALAEAFQLRDMLTFVENKAPNTLLEPQEYASHVRRSAPSPATV